MKEVHGAVSVPRVRPGDFAACASALAAAAPRAFDAVIESLASEQAWSREYVHAIALRYVALGRYLQSPSRLAAVPDVLLVLAAAATPVTADAGFDPALLESVACHCADQLSPVNELAI